MAESFSATQWWTPDTVAVVTGANKGIGFEIARMLAAQGMKVVATARDQGRGAEALGKLQEAAGPDGASRVLYHQLDIADTGSVDAFVKWADQTCPQGVAVLVNNAGFAYKGDIFGAEECRVTLAINYFGTAEVTEKLLPLLRKAKAGGAQARIVNVSSRAGSTSIVRDKAMLGRFTGAASRGELDALATGFVEAIRAGSHVQQGYPNTMYGVSKLCLSMYTRLLAAQLGPEGIPANAMCPGWCATDMSSWRGPRSATQGADTAVWLALRSFEEGGSQTGKLWADREAIAF